MVVRQAAVSECGPRRGRLRASFHSSTLSVTTRRSSQIHPSLKSLTRTLERCSTARVRCGPALAVGGRALRPTCCIQMASPAIWKRRRPSKAVPASQATYRARTILPQRGARAFRLVDPAEQQEAPDQQQAGVGGVLPIAVTSDPNRVVVVTPTQPGRALCLALLRG